MRISVFLLAVGSLLAIPAGVTAQQESPINDTDIKVTGYEELTYPTLGVMGNMQGIVVVRVKLDDEGKVVDAVALSGWLILRNASIENAKKWRFEPNAQKAAIIVYNFRIEGICFNDKYSSHMIFYPPNFASITDCGGHPSRY